MMAVSSFLAEKVRELSFAGYYIRILSPAVLRNAWKDFPSQPVRSIPAASTYSRRATLKSVGLTEIPETGCSMRRNT